MIVAIAVLDVKPDKTEEIEDVCRQIASQYNDVEMAPGLHSWCLVKSIEDPHKYVIHGYWDEADDHTDMGKTEFGAAMTELLQACLNDAIINHYTLIDGSSVGPNPLQAAAVAEDR